MTMPSFLRRSNKFIACIVLMVFVSVSYFAEAEAEENISKRVQEALNLETCNQFSLPEAQFQSLKTYYLETGFLPIWLENGSANTKANIMLTELQRSTAHGLKPEFYHYDLLNDLAESKASGNDLACFEVLLSKAFVLYANDIANGHVQLDEYPEHTIINPVTFGPEVLLGKATDEDGLQSFLKTLLTTDDRYVRLISKLAEFLRIEKLDAWPEIRNLGSSENPAVDPEKVKELLLFTGDLSAKDLPEATRESIEYLRAVARFQARHGLEVTQQVDAPTFREMAMPLGRKIDLIRINLERRRWQNRDLGPEHVYINVADRSLRFVRKDKKSGSTKFKPAVSLSKLPTFSGSVSAVKLSGDDALILEVLVDSADEARAVEFELEGDARQNLENLLGRKQAEQVQPVEQARIVLDNPVQTYVTYLTVWANKDGSINFRPDKLKRDDELAEILGISKR
ncbi:MAG: hypothetical protein AAGA76_12265 [Pseudomonadota bacterium]